MRIGRSRHVTERLDHRVQRGFWTAVAARETERPVVDLGASAKPLVRPGEYERAGAPGRKDRADLPVERLRLRVLAVPKAVQPRLGHD